MTLREYLFGRRVVLHSAQRKDRVIERIRRAVPSPFGLVNHGVSGGVWFGRLRLAWDTPMFRNGFRPVFRGRFVERGHRTELHSVFGAPTFLRVWFAGWYLFLALFAVVGLRGLFADGIASESLAALSIVPVFAFVPIGFHLFFNSGADAHYAAILALLEREAGLVPAEAAG